LVGLVRPEKGILQVRNRIYHHVFDEKWISETMPRDGLRWLAIASPVIALLVLAFFLVPVYLGIATPWNRSPASIQEKTLRESFLSTTSADVQISSMAQLIKLGSAGMARDLFFGLSLAQQVALFENANVDAVGREAITSVVDLVFSDESVSADVRLAILAKLFESTGYEADAKRLFSEELSSADRIALFRTATVPLVGPQIVAVFEAVCHSASADVRLAILARLLEGDAYRAQARQLFFKELSPEEQIVLFQTADPQAVGPELVAAVRGIYPQLNNTQNNNKLLAAMAQSLREMSNPEAASLSSSIDQWLMGREAYDEARNETALAALNEVIKFDSENTEAYFDRALIYVQSEDYEEALADLETALKLDDEKRLVSRTKLTIDSDLKFAQAWMELMDQYPTLKAALPRSSVTTTNVIVQASGEGESTVELSINDDAGNRICGDMIVLTQGQSYEASAASSCQARGRFVGSGVVSSDQPVSAVNLDLVTLQSGELEFVTRAHMDAAMSLPSAKSFLPLVATAPNFLRSAALIRNFGSNSTKAEVYFLDRSGRVFARKTVELSAGGLKYIGISDTQDTIAAPEGWSGTVEVVSEMGSVVASGYGCQEFYCTEYIGFSSGSRHWFVPGLARDVLTTGETKAFSVLSIMNTSETDQAEVTITFRNTGKQERRIIPSLGSVEISTQKMAGLPSESTAEIRSEGAEIVVTAQYLNPPDNQGEAYNALAAEEGGKELFLPDVSWAEERNGDTIIYLQSLTGTETVPTLFLYDRVSVEATGTSTPTVELAPALPFYGGKLPVQPFEQEMSPLGVYQTLKIDVG
jgi:tetratricopeptide (TPR) repeat protein